VAENGHSSELQPGEAPAHGDAPTAPAAVQRTILLVDDEELIRTVGRRMIERLGFRVLTAAGGREAVELVRAQAGAVDGLVLDLLMPEVDGAATLRQLRREGARMPVLVASAYPRQQIAHRFIGLNVSGFLLKPYQLDTLAAALRNMFE
jgi:two-component system, cell cycle sensor histidine kinase and response regulator CckA